MPVSVKYFENIDGVASMIISFYYASRKIPERCEDYFCGLSRITEWITESIVIAIAYKN